jgi:small-conductance mechanosensitive channel
LLVGANSRAQTPGSPAAQNTAGSPSAGTPVSARALPDAEHILQFLDQVVAWYRDRAGEQQLATEPADVLALSDSRATATQIVQLGFEFARSAADLVAAPAKQPVQADNAGQFQQLSELQDRLEQQAQQLQGRLGTAQGRLPDAAPGTRRMLQAQVAVLQAQASLLSTRRDTVGELLAFLAGGSDATGANGLKAQIETLAGSIAAENTPAHGTAASSGGAVSAPTVSASVPALSAAAPANGIWDLTARAFSLNSKIGRIQQFTRQTDILAQAAGGMRVRLLSALRNDSSMADDLVNQTAATAPDATGELAGEQGRLNTLTAQFKSIASAMLPLTKLGVLLGQYHSQLDDWRDSVRHQYDETLRNLGIRVAVVVFVLLLVLAASEVWRRAVNRYIRDARRRYQFLLLRRFVLWFVIAIVLASTLASRLDSFVTFAGLITAGIAVAMQNVILSVVGYFFLIGKYGIRVGDRVQIGDVRGEVIDVGLVRMYLMEFGHSGLAPTGRVVAFSNSIVFQATGGLFKQIPGVNFTWHEITVTLARATDSTAIRDRLQAAVDAALVHDKDELERQNREIERAAITLPRGALHASVRLRFTVAGIQAAIRYPVEQRGAQTDEMVSREVLKALELDPKLQPADSAPPQLEFNAVPEA